MDTAHQWIGGQPLQEILEENLGLITQYTTDKIADLHGPTTIASLQIITRSVEELINIELAARFNPTLRGALEQEIGQDHVLLMSTLDKHFDAGVSRRARELLPHVTFLRNLLETYHTDSAGQFSKLRTYMDLAKFLQARRSHLNTLMYAITDLARGDNRPSVGELYGLVFDTIELSFVGGLTGLHHKLTMLAVFPDFRCQTDGTGLLDVDPRSETLLDDDFLDAERMSITEIDAEASPDDAFDRRKITSAPELRHQQHMIENSYEPYGLAEQGFADLRRFTEEVTAYIKDDYYLRIPADAFKAILTRYDRAPWRAKLVYRPDVKHPFLGSYAAFAEHQGVFYSDLMMLLRFTYRVRDYLLERNRRYQIKSGFIFEDTLQKQLPTLGFEVLDIKRIDHKEFDVVAKREGDLYNFQCKNVCLDRELMETNLRQFVRNNRRIVRYFKRALIKEEGREELLRKATGTQTIKHFVVSRFPVFNEDARIISMRNLAYFFS
ncbi:hypothetical protein KWH45_04330 [Xanthomonas campestris pv. mirabilis]|uniref:hypothetical protein n=1 Tax=Xanthomonas euvesicatoria TaxID=456327 RepID=UPI001C4639FD|nr:hypothetical protein [Xanthomonas euvesicatoria]MBV6852674.1 hypothetical protein [Xanthomonas campestris pv. mirabilis]